MDQILLKTKRQLFITYRKILVLQAYFIFLLLIPGATVDGCEGCEE